MRNLIRSLFQISFIILFLSGCSGNSGALEHQLAGKWNRADGDYALLISAIKDNGQLSVEYFNPSPINVGRSGWRINDDVLQVYVELRDENYPGSIYQLSYNEESDILTGTYYQAVSRQTYDVYFTRQQ